MLLRAIAASHLNHELAIEITTIEASLRLVNSLCHTNMLIHLNYIGTRLRGIGLAPVSTVSNSLTCTFSPSVILVGGAAGAVYRGVYQSPPCFSDCGVALSDTSICAYEQDECVDIRGILTSLSMCTAAGLGIPCA